MIYRAYVSDRNLKTTDDDETWIQKISKLQKNSKLSDQLRN